MPSFPQSSSGHQKCITGEQTISELEIIHRSLKPSRCKQRWRSENALAGIESITAASGSCKQSLRFENSFSYLLLWTRTLRAPRGTTSSPSHSLAPPGASPLLSRLLTYDPSPLWIAEVWLRLSVFPRLLSPLSSDSHAASSHLRPTSPLSSFSSPPPSHRLSAILTGDEKHCFSELSHPGGRCLAFGRRW